MSGTKIIPVHTRGFTVIELLVVISVIVVISSVGLVSFVSYSRSQVLVQAANDLKLGVERAKFNSLSKVKPPECSSNDSVSSYSVHLCENCADYTYEVVATCGEEEIPVLTKKFRNNLSLTDITCSSITFYVLTNTIACTDSEGSLPASVELNAYGDSKTISIDAIGNVAIE